MARWFRRPRLILALLVTATATVSAVAVFTDVFSSSASNTADAHALNGGDLYGVGTTLTLTLKLGIGVPVYITPIYTVNHLKGSVLLESVSPLVGGSSSRLLGQYQFSGCDAQPSFIFAAAQEGDGPLRPASPFWLHSEFLPWSECAKYRYWADRIEFLKAGVSVVHGYVATYRYQGVTSRDKVDDVDFKFIVERRPRRP